MKTNQTKHRPGTPPVARIVELEKINAELFAALCDMVHFDDLQEREQAIAMEKARAALSKVRP